MSRSDVLLKQIVLAAQATPDGRRRGRPLTGPAAHDDRSGDLCVRAEHALLNSREQASNNFINAHGVLPVRVL